MGKQDIVAHLLITAANVALDHLGLNIVGLGLQLVSLLQLSLGLVQLTLGNVVHSLAGVQASVTGAHDDIHGLAHDIFIFFFLGHTRHRALFLFHKNAPLYSLWLNRVTYRMLCDCALMKIPPGRVEPAGRYYFIISTYRSSGTCKRFAAIRP